MTKDEALRLALEALEKISMGNDPRWADQVITAIKAALEAKDELVCVCGAVWEGQELVIAPPEEAKDEIDWRDMYEKQKRRSEMWVAKYEKDIGPLEKAVPHQEAKDEPVQTIPNFDQLQQIVNNLERCLTRDSKHEFLRVWIRDWTEHKLSKHTPPQRTWVGLTDEDELDWEEGGNLKDLVKAIETKLKEKNNA